MYLTDLVNRGNIPVLEKVMAYSQARHMMLAENVANIDNPDYRAKQLDDRAFRQALSRAIDDRGPDPSRRLQLPRHEEFREDDQGRLVVTPSRRPAQNILFHDRTNPSIEAQMADVAENVLIHDLVSRLLRSQFDGLKTAIRGSVS